MSAPRWKRWSASPSGCAAAGPSSSPICAKARASTRLWISSRRRAGWARPNFLPRLRGRGTARRAVEGGPLRLPCARHLPRFTGEERSGPSGMFPRRFQVAETLHRRAHEEAVAFLDDALGIALLDVRVANDDIVLLAGVDDAFHPFE